MTMTTTTTTMATIVQLRLPLLPSYFTFFRSVDCIRPLIISSTWKRRRKLSHFPRHKQRFFHSFLLNRREKGRKGRRKGRQAFILFHKYKYVHNTSCRCAAQTVLLQEEQKKRCVSLFSLLLLCFQCVFVCAYVFEKRFRRILLLLLAADGAEWWKYSQKKREDEKEEEEADAKKTVETPSTVDSRQTVEYCTVLYCWLHCSLPLKVVARLLPLLCAVCILFFPFLGNRWDDDDFHSS